MRQVKAIIICQDEDADAIIKIAKLLGKDTNQTIRECLKLGVAIIEERIKAIMEAEIKTC